MKKFTYASLALWTCLSTSLVAQDAPEIPAEVVTFFKQQKVSFQTVNSYSVDGTVEITHSEALAKEMNVPEADRVQLFRFRVLAKNGYLKEYFERVVNGSVGTQSEIYYTDPDKVVTHVLDDDGIASLSSFKKSKRKLGIRDRCPAFLEYAFLQNDMDTSGIRAVCPDQLGRPETWKILKSLKQYAQDSLAYSLGREDGSTIVILAKSPFGEVTLYPRITKFLDHSNAPLRSVEIVDVAPDASIGVRPKTIKLSTFEPMKDGKSKLLAIWLFRIDKFSLNDKIEEDDLVFDPASANQIMDNDTKTRIVVPH